MVWSPTTTNESYRKEKHHVEEREIGAAGSESHREYTVKAGTAEGELKCIFLPAAGTGGAELITIKLKLS